MGGSYLRIKHPPRTASSGVRSLGGIILQSETPGGRLTLGGYFLHDSTKCYWQSPNYTHKCTLHLALQMELTVYYNIIYMLYTFIEIIGYRPYDLGGM